MARPKKRGLDYFPLDVDIFDNDKIFDVQNEYGPLGETVYLRLVCLVYRNGYYFKFESIEKLAAMVIRSIGNRWVDSRLEIVEIIKFLIDCGLFSKKFAEMNILTSKGIQTRFKLATERRRSGIIEYSLIGGGDDFAESVHENECGCDISQCDESDCSEENVDDSDLSKSKFDDVSGSEESAFEFESDDEEKNLNNEYSFEDNSAEDIFDSECFGMAKKSPVGINKNYYDNMSDFNDYFIDSIDDSKAAYNTFGDVKNTEIVSAYQNGGFCCNNPTKKSKVKESKVNKSKVKESREKESIFDTAVEKCDSLSAEKIVSVFNKECGSLPKVTKITADRIRAVKTAAVKINGDFEGLFKRVEKSDFLTGRNGKWLNCSFDWIFKPYNLTKILNGNYDNRTRISSRAGSFFFSNTYENEEEYYESLKKLSPCY